MYKSIILFAMFLLMATARSAAADYMFGAGYWDWSISGQVRYQSTSSSDEADLKDDLHLQDDSTSYLFAVIEHPVPLLPNVRLATANIDTSGSGTTSKTFTYGNTTYTASTNVDSEFKLDQTDVTLYYELLDNVVGLDLGLTGRSVDGHASVDDGINKETADFSGVLPLVYLAADVQLPFTGLSLGAAGSAISIGSDSVTDYNLYVRYTTDYLFGVEGGYRKFTVDIEDLDSTTGKMDFDGAYVNLFLSF